MVCWDRRGSVIALTLDRSEGEILVGAMETGMKVEIHIQDHGEGIPPQVLEHIFDRFYRGEAAESIPGLGLGLAIAEALEEGQGGTIRMESELGKGSVLILQFPVDNPGTKAAVYTIEEI